MKRECGSCQLCCKLLPVRELDKLDGQRCRHQRAGKGCGVYQSNAMPPSCRLWSCQWLLGQYPGTRPDRVHYVVDCMPDYVTARNNVTGEEQHIPVVQVWVDPAFPDAHRDAALRRWLDETRQAAIIRYSAGDGFVLFPPSMSDDRQWHEEGGMSEETHNVRDIAKKIGGIKMTIEVEK